MAEHLRLQAHLLPEVLASLVALARRSQPDREGLVNSRIPKTLTTSISRDPGVDKVLPVWLPWVDRAAREAKADPHGPHHAATATSPTRPFPLGVRPAGGLQFAVKCHLTT